MSNLQIISAEEVTILVSLRDGEVKLGERVHTLDPAEWVESLKACPARFVLLGIPEDIGVRANYGIGGTHTAWSDALKAILNLQNTDSLSGDSLAILGSFNFSDWMKKADHMDIPSLRDTVSRIDEEVFHVVREIIAAGKVPIVIGGGHNNCYPLLKAASTALGFPVNCINLDPHSDFRAMEGRHSGNGFRYAKMEGYLRKYAIIGLHRNYNSQTVVEVLQADPDVQYSFYEEMFLHEKDRFYSTIEEAIRFTSGTPTGIELDLDAIAGVLASAATPSGVSSLQARQYVTWCAQLSTPAYLHLPEGIISRNDGRADPSTGKLLAYLVSDFMRG